MTRLKICGLTRQEDVQAAVNYGADALGLVFYSKSPRNVTLEQAASLTCITFPFVSIVGLFVNPGVQEVERVLNRIPLQVLQFHGDEPRGFCEQFGLPYLKALRVREGQDLVQYAASYASAQAVLLDAYEEGIPGGTGKSFNWSLVPHEMPLPVILSGGLQEKNVLEAISRVRPYAVDVSSGVEIEKGIKSAEKIAAFARAVRKADAGLA